MTAQVAFLFPGQGSQVVGMGADVFAASAAARSVFEAVDQALGFSLSTLCFEGPEDVLRETSNAQPAIVTVSLALLAAFQAALSPSSSDQPGQSATTGAPSNFPTSMPSWSYPLAPTYTAGHSVGEYAALVTGGALDLPGAARLVRERGRLMHAEGVACAGGMAAIIGMDAQVLQDICQEAMTELAAGNEEDGKRHEGAGKVIVANYNAPGQIVISGEQQALGRAMELARARGAKRVIPLSVSGAFHSPVMQPAAAALARIIAATDVHDATIPIISNISAAPLTTSSALRAELAQQIAAPVHWTQTIEYLVSAGVTVFIEIGPGQALTGMVKRIAKGVTMANINTREGIEKVTSLVREMGLCEI